MAEVIRFIPPYDSHIEIFDTSGIFLGIDMDYRTFDLASLYNSVTYLLCGVGFTVFLLTRVIGIAPISKARKDRYDELIHYLHRKIKRVGNGYRLPPELEKEMRRDLNNEGILTKVAHDIIRHCRLRPDGLRVRVGMTDPGAAGIYMQKVITINQSRNTGFSKTLAVLIHECMHFYLNSRGLHLRDSERNEYLTDIATIYMGFGDYISKGYVMAGYIKRNEIRYIRRRIDALH